MAAAAAYEETTLLFPQAEAEFANPHAAFQTALPMTPDSYATPTSPYSSPEHNYQSGPDSPTSTSSVSSAYTVQSAGTPTLEVPQGTKRGSKRSRKDSGLSQDIDGADTLSVSTEGTESSSAHSSPVHEGASTTRTKAKGRVAWISVTSTETVKEAKEAKGRGRGRGRRTASSDDNEPFDKRERNKQSAANYRKRRKMLMESLEGQVAKLTGTVQTQVKTITSLDTENKMLKEQLEFLRNLLAARGQSVPGLMAAASGAEFGAAPAVGADFLPTLPPVKSEPTSAAFDFGQASAELAMPMQLPMPPELGEPVSMAAESYSMPGQPVYPSFAHTPIAFSQSSPMSGMAAAFPTAAPPTPMGPASSYGFRNYLGKSAVIFALIALIVVVVPSVLGPVDQSHPTGRLNRLLLEFNAQLHTPAAEDAYSKSLNLMHSVVDLVMEPLRSTWPATFPRPIVAHNATDIAEPAPQPSSQQSTAPAA